MPSAEPGTWARDAAEMGTNNETASKENVWHTWHLNTPVELELQKQHKHEEQLRNQTSLASYFMFVVYFSLEGS